MQHYEQKFNEWINTISSALNDDSEVRKDDKDAGKQTNMDYHNIFIELYLTFFRPNN